MNTHRRVVVTGIGVIAPNGSNLETFWKSVVEGKSSASWLTRFDSTAMPCKLACEVKDFQPEKWMDAKRATRLDRAIRYTIGAGKMALADANIEPWRIDPDRIGIVEGTSVCGLENTLDSHTRFVAKGYRSIQPTLLVSAFPGGGSSELATELDVRCQATTITTACSSGNDALGYAMRTIQEDDADVMIAGASEAPLVDGYYSIFAASTVMSRERDNPMKAMRPFDRDRDGFVLGEGAAFMVVEELLHARARGARIYCELIGHGQACDAHNMVALHPQSRGCIAAIQKAMRCAQIGPADVDYVNAHGSATGMNDVLETNAIVATLKDRARKIPVSATKPVTGHLAGASAAVEAVICALALRDRIAPPTINLDHPADGCILDYVPHTARSYPLDVALSLSAGFGGKHSALLLRRFPG